MHLRHHPGDQTGGTSADGAAGAERVPGSGDSDAAGRTTDAEAAERDAAARGGGGPAQQALAPIELRCERHLHGVLVGAIVSVKCGHCSKAQRRAVTHHWRLVKNGSLRLEDTID